MAGPDRQGSTRIDRGHSMPWVAPPMAVSDDEDDDDDDDLAAGAVSDGFRPSPITNTNHNNNSFIQSTDPIDAPPSTTRRSIQPPPRPSSATKPKRIESFTLRHDGAMGHVTNLPSSTSASNTAPSNTVASNTAAMRHLSTSTASEVYVRREGPYQGPSRPSHPYQMYPQESRIARTASIATTVMASERSYAGPTGPTHPYGMYPQGTVTESESDAIQVSEARSIPVGFLGSSDNYQRRIGPEGEEIAGIIGPDGHTEELPPYTQFPDEALARKDRLANLPPIDGAGGIGLATRNPEFASQEDLTLANPSQSSRSIHSVESNSNANDIEPGPSEKQERRWQKFARQKVCRIVPMWAVILAATTLVLFALILGVTLHVLKSNQNEAYEQESSTGRGVAPIQRMFDAVPISKAPSGLPTLPTGTYALPLSLPSVVQSSCLNQPEQSRSWSCSMPQSPLQMQILDLPGATNQLANKEIILDYGVATMRGFPFGTQPPVLDDPLVLSLVTDTQDPQRGPAWFFQTIYNKIVIVPEDLLSSPFDKKRDLEGRTGASHHHDDLPSTDEFIRRGSAPVGSSPWFCFWNGTLLEAFLYVNQTSSEAAHAESHATTGSVSPTSSASKTSSVSGATPTPSGIVIGADEEYAWGIEHDLLSAYPKVLKFQERRVPEGAQAIPPYCTKRTIAPDGSARDVTNSTGSVITIFLTETVPSEVEPLKRALLFGETLIPNTEVRQRRANSDSTCGCVWVAT